MTAALQLVPEAPAPVRRTGRRLHAVPATGFLPRVAPPRPRVSDIEELRKAARLCDRMLWAWQDLAGEYMTAVRRNRWLYPEIVLVVGRQNGKTGILLPRIVMGLLRGERIMMTAQDRQLIVRDVFNEVADVAERAFPEQMKGKPRRANGQESISMLNGGRFRIVAPTRGGARGPSNDLVIIDEAREMTDHDFVAAAQPTLTRAKGPRRGQTIYLSNAGTDASVVLNALRKRAEADQTLGYLEWSSRPDRARDDRTGWHEANPSLAQGGPDARAHMRFLEDMHAKYVGEGTPEIFDTEHRCLWVTTELPRVVQELAWERAGELPVGEPDRPVLGIAQDPQGRRCSAVIAWVDDGIVMLHVLADFDGYPVDLKAAAERVTQEMRRLGCRHVAFDNWTDRDWARYFKDPKPMKAAEWEAGCLRFAREVESGTLRYSDPDGALTADMAHTVRHDTAHAWIATPASAERATTASLAAIRATWLATNPTPPPPQVY